MASAGQTIGAVLGTVLGFFFVFFFVSFMFFFCCCAVYVEDDDISARTVSLKKLRLKYQQPDFWISWKKKTTNDLEKQTAATSSEGDLEEMGDSSRVALADFHGSSEKASDAEKPRSSKQQDMLSSRTDGLSKQEIEDVISEFNNMTDGLLDSKMPVDSTKKKLTVSKRMTSLVYKKKKNNRCHASLSDPTESEQCYLSDQYDSFSRTLMLQRLIENSINNKSEVIKTIKDPFLNNYISVGGIVVVVRPFKGEDEYEFGKLMPGDLLRILKFFVKGREQEDGHRDEQATMNTSYRHSTHSDLSSKFSIDHNSDKNRKSVYLDDKDPNYKNIYCTGILLNTYLEHNETTKNLSLKLRNSTNWENDLDYLKDFPLDIVSLETTVLRNYSIDGNLSLNFVISPEE